MLASLAMAVAMSCTGPADEVKCDTFRLPVNRQVELSIPGGCRVEQLEFLDARDNLGIITRSGEIATDRSLKVKPGGGPGH
jgi:hypothetical protein